MRSLPPLRAGHRDPRNLWEYPADLAREITTAVNLTRLLASGDTTLLARLADAVEPYARPGERGAAVAALLEELAVPTVPPADLATPERRLRLRPGYAIGAVVVLLAAYFGILTQLDHWGTTGLLIAVSLLIVATTTAIISLLTPTTGRGGRP